ncbi:hypothetical protein Tco_1193309 [Tanacetum coccineum]
MVSYLKKPIGSEGFQEIVDFLNDSYIRYALTKNPTIYVSLIKTFWQTDNVRTVDNGEQEITATVNGKEFTITEASVSRVHTLGSDEGSMTLQELTVLCTTLSKKVESLEADLKQTKKVYGATYTKLIKKVKKLEKIVKSNHARRRAKIVVSEDQPDDQLGVFSAAKVLADAAKENVHIYTRRKAVNTGSGGISTTEESVSTAGASIPVSTAGMGFKRLTSVFLHQLLGHEAAMRLQEELDEEERQRMARVHEAAQSFIEEEWENIRAKFEANEELSKRLQAEERNKYSKVDQAKMLVDLINQRKKYFVCTKAEAKRNNPDTLSSTKLKELFETTMKNVTTFVPMETKDRGRAPELAAGSSQATIIDSAEVGSSKRDAEAELDHEGSKRQKTNEASGSVQEQPEEEEKELSQEDLQQMMMVVPVEEVYVEALQRYMHDPLKWRLYDTCGVHHVSTERGTDIFMLVEKEYPLSKGVLTLMLVNRLLVEQHLEMENELLRKIFIQENRPRQ